MSTPRRGERGERGYKGDKGDKGDHQKGDRGMPGMPVVGATGATGKTGPSGKDARYLDRKQILALFAFVVVAFLLLAWRSEVNADKIQRDSERISRNQFQSCTVSRDILLKFNAQQRGVIAIERTNKFIDDVVRAKRIKVYTEAILPVPDCEALR